MNRRVVYFNGVFVPESEARLSIYDSGLLMGEMAFEVTRTIHHIPFRLEAHIARLYHSLAGMRIDPGVSQAELLTATLETLARNLPTEPAEVDWNIIHNVSRGPSHAFAEAFLPHEFRPTVMISAFPLLSKIAVLAEGYAAGVDLVVPSQRALPHELLDSSLKTRSRLHYQLANLEANEIRRGSTPALVDPDGFLTEGSSGNLFVVRAGRLETPHHRNLLPGVTRRLVLELAEQLGIPAVECDLTPAAAEAADELFLTSTTIGIMHARSLNGRTIGSGQAGPMTLRLREALHESVGLDFVAQAQAYARRLQI